MDLFIFLGQRGRRLSRARKVCAVSGTPGVPWGQPGTSQAGSRLGFCNVDESINHFDYMKVRAFSAYKIPFPLNNHAAVKGIVIQAPYPSPFGVQAGQF